MLRLFVAVVAVAVCVRSSAAFQPTSYTLDDSPCGSDGLACRRFDGIGAISGGGATSRLLVDYPEPARSDILDYLFKPGYGASLHTLKVEIGSDAETTDGAEACHMRDPWNEDYNRGYEWWLMKEAKARNPAIQLYGLPWGWPVWVTCNITGGTMQDCQNTDPFTYPQNSADYVAKWVAGAATTHGLHIDYIGSWNERYYNTSYIKLLRQTLDAAGLNGTAVVAPDGEQWQIAQDVLDDPALAASMHAIGAHYPGTQSTPQAEATGLPLWASEDFSTYNNAIGAGCWARVLNQNYVTGNVTATIAWNLVAAYMKGTHWYRTGLLNALTPWSGGYGTFHADGTWTVGEMVWATAHTTQFTQPGWRYLLQVNGSAAGGSGMLTGGGSYVTLKNFSSGDFTLVIEKMSRNHSACVRPGLGQYEVQPETATFALAGALAGAGVTSLHVWRSHWAFNDGDQTEEFIPLGTIPLVDGVFSLNITVDSVYTLTTLSTGAKGSTGAVPPLPTLFPAAHTDDFEGCSPSSEAPYFSDQNGAFECYQSGDATHGTVMRQSVPFQPLHWYDVRPHAFIGHRDSHDQSLVVDAYIEEPGASMLLGLRVQGTDNWVPNGLFWSVLAPADGSGGPASWFVHTDLGSVDNNASAVASGSVFVAAGQWHTYRLDVNGTTFRVWVDSVPIVDGLDVTCALPSCTATGHGVIGTREYGHFTQFDNFQLYTAYTQCGSGGGGGGAGAGASVVVAGTPVSIVECSSEVGPRATSQWLWSAASAAATPGTYAGSFALRANTSLCMSAVPNTTSQTWWVNLQPCNADDPLQVWAWSFNGIAPDGEQSSTLWLPSGPGAGRCLDVSSQGDIGAPADAWPCNGQTNQAMFWDYAAGEIGNEAYAVCMGVC